MHQDVSYCVLRTEQTRTIDPFEYKDGIRDGDGAPRNSERASVETEAARSRSSAATKPRNCIQALRIA